MLPYARLKSSFRYHHFAGHRQFTLAALAPATLALILAGAASAQDASPDADPPALVGRIAGVEGSVSLLRTGEQDWEQAGVNEPISVGDAVYAQDSSTIKLEIGATDLRVQPDSEMDVAALDQQTGQLRLDVGVVNLRVAALPTADGLLIDTPRGTVKLTQPGIYRIDAGADDQPTSVTAWNGAAQLGNTSAGIAVQPNQTLLITGTVDAPQYAFQPAAGGIPAEFRQPVRAIGADQHYVAADMTGAEDLYQYGSFQTAAQSGAVWYPTNVPADWQPYRYGHWENVAPWGQTWIDDQPWGFAPFHYGRWAFAGNRWGWYPGEYTPHPVYAPALVAFVGGGGFGAAISFGGGAAIGWVPLGPGEAYRPPYHVNQTYIENINRTVVINKTVINNYGPGQERPVGSLANARFATVVPAAAMSGGRPIAAAAIHVQPQALEHVSVNPQAVTEVPKAPANAGRPAARPGPVAPVAVTRGGPAPRPALPATRPGAQPGRPVAPVKQEGQPNQPGAPATPPRPETGRPGAPPATPGATPPAGARPGTPPPATRPETARPETARPEATRPEAGRPETARPEAARPAEPARPAAPKPEAARPEAARPEAARPEAARPEAARPEAPKPEAARPEAKAPAEPHPAPVRPSETRPEPRPEPPAARPEARPPAPHPEARPEAKPPAPEAKPAPPKPEPKKPEPKKPEDENK